MANIEPIHGISCDIYRAKDVSEHFHQDIELIFVVEGCVKIVIDRNEYFLNKNEIILINSNKSHSINVVEKSIICKLSISYKMLVENIGEENITFWCNTLTDKDIKYPELCGIFRDIIILRLDDNQKDLFKLLEKYCKLINILIRDFKINNFELNKSDESGDNEQIKRIVNYINLNYQDVINLQDLAEHLFVSVSTLSRMFKKAMGVKFPDYVNQVRMYHAISDLLNTNKSMTDIAVDNGFSSPSTFNRVFKEMYNTSPSLYKKDFRKNDSDRMLALSLEDEEQIRQFLIDNNEEKEIEKPTIDIFDDTYTYNKRISTRTVTVGAFFAVTGSIVQKQVKDLVEKLELSHIRMWNIFSPKCMIADSPDDKELNFEYINVVLDFLISINVHPFLDMTDHPECLIKSGRELYYKTEDSMGFQNLDQWLYFLEKFLEHVIYRYGSHEVGNWIFEFGDLPIKENNAYYQDNQYGDIYPAAYKMIKKYSPDSKVGGPDWIFDGSLIDVEKHFSIWRKTGTMPDFYSIFMFPYKSSEGNDQLYISSKERDMDPDFMENQIRDLHRKLKDADAPERPIYVTETTTILSNRNAMNDHCGRGTNVLRVTNIFEDYVDMVCFWVASDRLSLRYAPPTVLHGGSGLISKDGIPKPSFYSLMFLNKLGEKILAKGLGYIVTKTENNGYYILCYNYKNLIYSYRYEEENQVNVYNVDDMFVDKDLLNLKFMLHGLEKNQEYVVKRHVINQNHGSAMDEWKRLDFERNMRNNDIEYLKNACVPKISMKHRIAEEGRIFIEAKLDAHEMQLIHIFKSN